MQKVETREKNPSPPVPRQSKTPDFRGFWKRMMGLEPTTFCMATRPLSLFLV
jgi:hypothetical protein